MSDTLTILTFLGFGEAAQAFANVAAEILTPEFAVAFTEETRKQRTGIKRGQSVVTQKD